MTGPEGRCTDLGAYLIGSLAPAERSAVERHLAGCPQCRAELAVLAPLPGLLGRISAEDVRSGALTPGPGLLPRALDGVRSRQRAQRRRLRRWRLAAVAAAVLAVAAVAVPPPVRPGTAPDPVPPAAPLSTAAGVGATGTGGLTARPWGTAIALELRDLPAAPGYVAWARSRDGRGEVAASWGATPDGRAVVTGATAIARADLAAVQIRTSDGRPLLTLPG